MSDFKNLTLSDFYNMDIMVRSDGSRTPIVEVLNGKNIGLVGYNGSPELSDIDLKEDAFNYYQRLIKELNKKL